VLPRLRFSAADEDLFRAARHGDRAGIGARPRGGARVGGASPVDGKTALFRAAVFGHADAVRLLLERGADTQARGNDGRTALEVVDAARGEERDPRSPRPRSIGSRPSLRAPERRDEAGAAAVLLAVALAACMRVEPPPTAARRNRRSPRRRCAGDLAAVRSRLDSGADPNKLVAVQGRPQSSWFLALDRLRPKRPVTIEIVKAMLAKGAPCRSRLAQRRRRSDPAGQVVLAAAPAARAARARTISTRSTSRWSHASPEVLRALLAGSGWEPRLGEARSSGRSKRARTRSRASWSTPAST
jgi:hypothetical protein